MARATAVTLDELLALSDEIAALARAGVPLPRGLQTLGRDLPGRLGRLATELGERLARGESLEQAFGALPDSISPIYAAVVAAGVRAGRLPAALESLSTSVRRVAETRRVVTAALVYPLVVLLVATLLFVFASAKLVPIVAETYRQFDLGRPLWYELLLGLSSRWPLVVVVFWGALGLLAAIWWYRSTRTAPLSGRGLELVPSFRRILRASRLATFAEILAMLVEQQVPAGEAVVLAATASGDARLQAAGTALAAAIERGEEAGRLSGAVPPFLRWLLTTRADQRQLVVSLRQSGESYRREVVHWGQWLGLYLPIFLSAGIGGAAVLLFALLVLAPFYHLLYALS